MTTRAIGLFVLTFVMGSAVHAEAPEFQATGPTKDDGTWYILSEDQLPDQTQNTTHLARFGDSIEGYNRFVLAGVDKAQSSAMDGGGYFIGIKADPPESPIGYALSLMGNPLLSPPRTTSYCSGSTYTAFIEALNLYETACADGADPSDKPVLDPVRAEAMRMQEPDGGRREDGVKFWGHWNDDGFGSQFALVQYSKMGEEVTPNRARPGDFMNISWTNGGGHSVVFLGWQIDTEGNKHVLYWASQKSTNGMGDQLVPLSRIRSVKIVRLTDPDRLFTFDPTQEVNPKVPGDTIDW
ncbi:MAG: hypothetical protein R3C45_17405 [Phycisphaerales bacterium]